MTRFRVDQRRQKDVPQAVETDGVEVSIGEIELEAAAEVLDVVLELRPVQDGNGRSAAFETSLPIHGPTLWNGVVVILVCTARCGARVVAIGNAGVTLWWKTARGRTIAPPGLLWAGKIFCSRLGSLIM